MEVTRKGESYVVADGHEWFWKMFADGSWEPSTFEIFDRFLDRQETFVDIGAWIGPTALYAARRAKRVFAFEPDPVAFRSLVQNLELNRCDNVVPYPVAVADSWKGIPFGPKQVLGDSMSGEIWAKAGDASKVPAVSLEGLVIDLAPNFVKIDIEGGEVGALDGAGVAFSQIQPTLHLSLHTPWFTGTPEQLERYKAKVSAGLGVYPFFYDQNLCRIDVADAFDPGAFNAVVASFEEIR